MTKLLRWPAWRMSGGNAVDVFFITGIGKEAIGRAADLYALERGIRRKPPEDRAAPHGADGGLGAHKLLTEFAIASTARSDVAAMVSVGLAVAEVGNVADPSTNRFG